MTPEELKKKYVDKKPNQTNKNQIQVLKEYVEILEGDLNSYRALLKAANERDQEQQTLIRKYEVTSFLQRLKYLFTKKI